MANLHINIGEKNNRLILLEYAQDPKRKHKMGKFKCDCGSVFVTTLYRVIKESTKSCGCYNKERQAELSHRKIGLKHGLLCNSKPDADERRRIYVVYTSMMDRCYNSTSKKYGRHGARGIRVCDEWRNNPVAHYDWCITNGYKKGLNIDREDNNGNYSPENCRVVTPKVNMNNKRSNRIVNFKGENMTISEMADLIGMDYERLRCRIVRSNMTPEEAALRPYKSKTPTCKTLT